jgi:hypothetical protein
MNQARWFMRSLFSTAALSNLALVIWAPFPILAAITLMPFGIPASDPRTWVIAIGVQVLFTALVMVGRRATLGMAQRSPKGVVIVVIVIAGAIRGIALVIAAASYANDDVTADDLVLRAVNSALLALLALGLIGTIMQFTRDYQAEYEVLRARAVQLQREALAPTQTLSDATIAGWIGVQRSLQTTADAARTELTGARTSARSLQAVADVIADALARQVRPISHGLWSGTSDAPPRLRAHLVAWDALRPWAPPIGWIVTLFFVITAVSAINRAGLAEGGVFAIYTTIAVTVALEISIMFGRAFPTSRAVGLITLFGMPILVLAAGVGIGQGLLEATPDRGGALFVGVFASVCTAGIVFLRRVTVERQMLLDALQARIDLQGLDVLAQRADVDQWGRSLGTFVHHSVQSELSALRLQLMEAASTDDVEGQSRARVDVLQRFDRLLALQPPWVQQRRGRTVIDEVARAWAGIAQVDVAVVDGGTDAQWAIAGNVVEEGVANAVRAGGARNVSVDIRFADDALVVTIDDDGRGIADPGEPGLGTWWLDQIAPGAWQRSTIEGGTRLRVHVR